MHLVIPTRKGAINESLRYALRAWQTHWPDAQVTLIGARPDWFTGECLLTDQKVGHAYQWSRNFPLALRAAADCFTEPFWWTADDIFPLRPCDMVTDPPTWCRAGDIDDYLASWNEKSSVGYRKTFLAGITSQRDIMRTLGISTQHNADSHMPHLLDPQRLDVLLGYLRAHHPQHPAGHFRAIYGGIWPGRVVRVKDPKIAGRTAVQLTDDWVSTAPGSWNGRAGIALRRTYVTPSCWEAR